MFLIISNILFLPNNVFTCVSLFIFLTPQTNEAIEPIIICSYDNSFNVNSCALLPLPGSFVPNFDFDSFISLTSEAISDISVFFAIQNTNHILYK